MRIVIRFHSVSRVHLLTCDEASLTNDFVARLPNAERRLPHSSPWLSWLLFRQSDGCKTSFTLLRRSQIVRLIDTAVCIRGLCMKDETMQCCNLVLGLQQLSMGTDAGAIGNEIGNSGSVLVDARWWKGIQQTRREECSRLVFGFSIFMFENILKRVLNTCASVRAGNPSLVLCLLFDTVLITDCYNLSILNRNSNLKTHLFSAIWIGF